MKTFENIDLEELQRVVQQEVDEQADNTYVLVGLIGDIRIATKKDSMDKEDWHEFGNDIARFIREKFDIYYSPFSWSGHHVSLTQWAEVTEDQKEWGESE